MSHLQFCQVQPCPQAHPGPYGPLVEDGQVPPTHMRVRSPSQTEKRGKFSLVPAAPSNFKLYALLATASYYMRCSAAECLFPAKTVLAAMACCTTQCFWRWMYNCPNPPPNSGRGVGGRNDTFLNTSLVVPPGGHPNSSVNLDSCN